MRRQLSALFLPFCAPAFALAQQEAPVEVQTAPIVTITVPEGASIDRNARSVTRPLADRGAGRSAQILERSRSLPLPIPAEVVAGASGDRIVREADGDPFFLGFAAGPYYPPAGEAVDPQLVIDLAQAPRDGRGQSEVYGFVMLRERISEELVEQLRDLGLRPLGFHPHHSLSGAMRIDAVSALARHPSVRWVGAARRWQKIDPRLQERLVEAQAGDVLDVWVNVFESDLCTQSSARSLGVMMSGEPGSPPAIVYDETLLAKTWMSNGWQQRALEGLGLGIIEYVDGVRAFRASGTPEAIARAIELDFVYFVEPKLELSLLHDESTPLVNSDAARALHNGGRQQAALAGVLDSGFNFTHSALDHVSWVGWDYRGLQIPGTLTSDDVCGHGTHVSGTLLALPSGTSNDEHTGNAPGLGYSGAGRFRYVRAFGAGNCPTANNCCWLSLASTASMYTNFATPYTAGGLTTPKAHVVNHSWGTPPCTTTCSCVAFLGTDVESRTADIAVNNDDILYVFAAGNSGACGIGSIYAPGVAKNVFTVGSVNDHYVSASVLPGTLSTFSSRGPTGDLRWKPNAVAPGEDILSVQAGGTFVEMDGTSMAAPHVTGIAAQLCDAHPFLRNAPARLSALLMGTAITKANAVLTSPNDTHLDQYGAGRVDALLAQAQLPWYSSENWGFTMDSGSNFQFDEFVVPANLRRLVVCMTYHEAASSPGASSVLLNNLDLWLDQAPIDPAGNTGEFFSQQSTRDNTEIRYVDNPAAGTWRWKVFPTTLSSRVKVSVQVVMIDAQTAPSLTVALSGHPWAKTGVFELGVDVEPSSGLASGVHIVQTAMRLLPLPMPLNHVAARSILKDGVSANHMDNAQAGARISLGNAMEGDPRTAFWSFIEPSETDIQINVQADADNTSTVASIFTVRTDGGRPTPVSNLRSTSHTVNTWSNNSNVAFAWVPGADPRSGVDGYSVLATTQSSASVDETIEIGAVSSVTVPLPSSAQGTYYYVRTVDRAGWGASTTVRTGPYLIDTVAPGLPAIGSTTHNVGVWSTNRTVAFQVVAANDAHSGIAGYSVVFDRFPGVLPPATQNLAGSATSVSFSVADSASPYYLKIRSRDNAGNWSPTHLEVGPYRIDGTEPGLATNLASSSHTVGAWTSNTLLQLQWTGAVDAHSGLRGYNELVSNVSGAVVPPVPQLGATTNQIIVLSSSTQPWYYSLRSVDWAGNWSSTSTQIGPFYVDAVSPTAPSSFSSSSHTPGVWSANSIIAVGFTGASDAHSGLAGYRMIWDVTPNTSVTSGSLNVAANATSLSSPSFASSSSGRYLHIAARDQAGNFGPTAHFGPFLIDTTAPNAPQGFGSTTHLPLVWNAQSTINFTWSGGIDPTSGVVQTALLLDGSPNTAPQTSGVLLGVATSTARPVIEGSAIYAHLAFRDAAGNWSPAAHIGPFQMDRTPPTGVTLVLNAGASLVHVLDVTADITASDALSGVSEMRFLNTLGQWSAWQPIASSIPWNLSNNGGSTTTGTRIVDLEVQDRAGNVTESGDSIRYAILPQVFGAGCAGAAGTPDISVSGIPTLGGSMTIASTPTSAATSSLYLGYQNQSWLGLPLPLDLGLVGIAGCSVHVSLDIALYSGPNAPIPLPIPADPLFGDAEVYFQWIHFADPSGRLLVTSPGVRVTLNNP